MVSSKDGRATPIRVLHGDGGDLDDFGRYELNIVLMYVILTVTHLLKRYFVETVFSALTACYRYQQSAVTSALRQL